MGLAKFFRDNIKTVILNEASGTDIDTSFRKGTPRNNLSSIFRGMNHGLYVKSAMKDGYNRIPSWKDCAITYPFVGIEGFSDHDVISVSKNLITGQMKDFFGRLAGNPKIESSLANVELRGGIPQDSYIFSPSVIVSNIGKGTKTSLKDAIFPQTSLTNSVRNKIGPEAVQQSINIDKNGDLYIDEQKKNPNIIKQINNAKAVLCKMTNDDLDTIINNIAEANHETPEKVVTDSISESLNSFFSKEANVNDNSNPSSNDNKGVLNSYNPNVGQFYEFFKDILGGNFDKYKNNKEFLREFTKRWIGKYFNSDRNVVYDKLIKKYFFLTPFVNTYCFRTYEDALQDKSREDSIRRDFVVYNKCISNPSQSEIDKLLQNDSQQSPQVQSAPQANVPYSSNGELDCNDLQSSIMAMCRMVANERGHSIFCFTEKDERKVHTKENDTVIRTHEGGKRIFLKLNRTGNATNTKLDFSSFFKNFGGILDENAPQIFDCKVIEATAYTFKVDPDVESVVTERSTNESIKSLFDEYCKNRGKLALNEPLILNLVYFINEDFISEKYSDVDTGKYILVDMEDKNVPEMLKSYNRGVQPDRIYSYWKYSKDPYGDINTVNLSNIQSQYQQGKRHSVHADRL